MQSIEVESVSARTPDWSREYPLRFWDPGRKLLRTIRQYQQLADKKGPLIHVRRKSCVLRHRFWSVICGAEIHLNSKIEGGFAIPHPNGIVIHPNVCIGPNCLVFQQVTIGSRGSSAVPTIGGHVDIGAGAKILGGVIIGDHVQIGANAVVLSDVPDFSIAVGIPARIVGSLRNEAEL